MELLTGVMATLWELLKEPIIPVINLSIVDFLLAVLVIKVVIDILNFLLGKQISDAENRATKSGEYRPKNKRR